MSWLQEYSSLLGMSAEQVSAAFGDPPDGIGSDRSYGSMEGLDAIKDPQTGARAFMYDDQVVLVYLPRSAMPADVDDAAMRVLVSCDPDRLRSRQGKAAHTDVVAAEGVAWSALRGEVGFVEVFPPTTLEDYVDHIHTEPPAFRN